jgi:hypothetical protein
MRSRSPRWCCIRAPSSARRSRPRLCAPWGCSICGVAASSAIRTRAIQRSRSDRTQLDPVSKPALSAAISISRRKPGLAQGHAARRGPGRARRLPLHPRARPRHRGAQRAGQGARRRRCRPYVWPGPQWIGAAPQKRPKAPALRKRRTSPAWAMIVAVRLGSRRPEGRRGVFPCSSSSSAISASTRSSRPSPHGSARHDDGARNL